MPSDWDIFCFAVEFVGQKSIELDEAELLAIAIALGKWLQAAHYSNPGRIYGEPEMKPKLVVEPGGEDPVLATQAREGAGVDSDGLTRLLVGFVDPCGTFDGVLVDGLHPTPRRVRAQRLDDAHGDTPPR